MKLTEWARNVRPIIEKASASLADADAVEAALLFPRWKAGEHYAAGDRRSDGGVLYRCLQEHDAQAGWNPAAAPSLWARVLIPDGTGIYPWEEPASTNPYARGDRVTHNGKTWESAVDNNSWEPGVHGWTEVSAS